MSNSKDYQKGYQAGLRKFSADSRELKMEIRSLEDKLARKETKEERAYFKSLELALQNCSNWQIDGKPVKTAEGFTKLADAFAKNSINRY